MFVDFDKIFNDKPQAEMKLPEPYVEYLSKNLPEGIQYKSDDRGNCFIVPQEGKPIKLSGFRYDPSDEEKAILGENYTTTEILQYLYNSQKTVPLTLNKEGIILLNDEEIEIDKIVYSPLKPLKYFGGKLHLTPPVFPPPFKLKFSNEKYSRILTIRRITNNSVSVAKYESDKDAPLFIELLINERSHQLSLTMSYDLNKAKTIKDIVESTSIYNAFVDGKGFISDIPIDIKLQAESVKKYDTSSIEFWERLMELEGALGVKFIPEKDNVESEEVLTAEQFYHNVIQKQPVISLENIDAVSNQWEKANPETLNTYIGKEILFEMTTLLETTIFGVTLSLPSLILVFNAKIKNIEEQDNSQKIIFEDLSPTQKRYTSILSFKSIQELENYRNSMDHNDMIAIFKDAKKIV